MIGRTLDGRYKLERMLGEGGMGAVYEATHTGTGRRVAVKLIQQLALGDTDVFSRFQREARASSAVDTRHIVQVLDSGRDPETKLPYMAMDLLRGQDLSELISRCGALPVDLAVRIVAQACNGLAKAHRAHVVHRDIKPANLFLSDEEDDEVVVKLLDFGIAKVRPRGPVEVDGVHLTQTGRLLGTPLYMSPEQAQSTRDIDQRTDLWSLGAVFYEVLTGRSPFAHCDSLGKLIIAICGSAPAPPSSVVDSIPPELDAIVMKALAIDRDARYGSAEEIAADLAPFLLQGPRIDRSELSGVRTRGAAPVTSPNAVTAAADDAPMATGQRASRQVRITPPAFAAVEPPGTPEEVGVASTLYATAKPRRRKRVVVLGAAGAIGALGVAGVLIIRAASNGDQADSAAAASARSSPDASVITPSAEPPEQTVFVDVDPPGVEVLVGGTAARWVEGRVALCGPDGTEHVVTLKKNGETVRSIVMIEGGAARPSRVSFTTPSSSASASAVVGRVGGPVVPRAPTSATAPKPAAPTSTLQYEKKFGE